MKYSLTLVSVLGLNLGLTFAQDAQMLTAVGFPACAVPCVQAGNKAAADKHGCTLMDPVCQCTTGFKTAQETVMGCIASTKPCADADMAKVATAGATLCAGIKQADPHAAPPNGTSSSSSASSSSGSTGSAGTGSAGTGSASTGSSGTGSAGTGTTAAHPSAAVTSASPSGAGGAKPAAGPSSTANAASPERTFAAGALGLVGAVIAMAL